MPDPFIKNLSIMTPDEKALISEKKVLVVGCGGLGGANAEILCRSGFCHLTFVDGDRFEGSNMNRQLLCTTETMGTFKAEAAAERARLINPDIDVKAVVGLFNESNARKLVSGMDIVIDALDNVQTRLLLEDTCETENVPLIHGAVSGWQLQVAVCMPGSRVLHQLYANKTSGAGSDVPGGVAINVSACASFQISEAIKLLLGRENVLINKVFFFDLIDKESIVLDFNTENR